MWKASRQVHSRDNEEAAELVPWLCAGHGSTTGHASPCSQNWAERFRLICWTFAVPPGSQQPQAAAEHMKRGSSEPMSCKYKILLDSKDFTHKKECVVPHS